eukprot:gene9401-10389_t
MDDETEFHSSQIFNKHRLDIVQSIDTEKQFMLSYLRSNSILDEEDCERINHGITRQEKVSKMLDILCLKGSDGVRHFVKAVEFEQPKLYEKITGKKADSGLDGKALVDFDREFLAKQLDRAMTDLKCMTYWQSKILKEKNNLEQKLSEATDDLQIKDKNMNDLQEKIIQFTAEKRAEATEEDSLQTEQPMQLYLQELWRDNMERSNVIIALQGRLLVANEEIEELKATNSKLAKKNEDFRGQVRNLTIVYDHERRNSKKLNETMISQTTESDVLRKEILKWKYDYNCVLEERDMLQNELEDVQKWGEILNARFDIITQEKDELEESSEDLASKYKFLQTYVQKLNAKLKLMEFSNNRYNIETDRLKGTIESLRKNRNSLNAAREAAILSRNEAIKEKARMENLLNETEIKYDQHIGETVESFKDLENKHCQLLKDINELHKQFEEKDQELQEIKHSVKNNYSPSNNTHSASDEEKIEAKEIEEDKDDDESAIDQSDASEKTTEKTSLKRGGVRKDKRTTRDLVDSIRRKVAPTANTKANKMNSLPTNGKSAASKGYLDYEQLSLIYPQQLNAACTMPAKLSPPASQQSLYLRMPDTSTDYKNKSMPNLKQLSPFKLSTMGFENMFAYMQHAKDNAARKNDRGNSFHERRQTFQKTSAIDEGTTEPFRGRLYCMDSTEGQARKARSVSSPANMGNCIKLLKEDQGK